MSYHLPFTSDSQVSFKPLQILHKGEFFCPQQILDFSFFVRYRVPAATESEAFRFDIAVISHTTCAAPRIATCFRRPYRHPRPHVNRFLHLHPACCLLAERCPQPGFVQTEKKRSLCRVRASRACRRTRVESVRFALTTKQVRLIKVVVRTALRSEVQWVQEKKSE